MGPCNGKNTVDASIATQSVGDLVCHWPLHRDDIDVVLTKGDFGSA